MEYKLKKLLPNPCQILLDMLECMSEKGTWITTTELSCQLALSLRTTQRYLNRLETVVAEYNHLQNKGFELEIDKKRGVRFSLNSDTDRLFLKKFIYQKDVTIQLLIQLFFKRRISKKKYCEEHYLANASFYQSLNRLEEFLATYGLQIQIHTLSLLGAETKIRIVGYSIAWTLFESEKWPSIFQEISEPEIERDIQQMITHLNLSVDFIKKREVTFSLAIALLRYHMGYPVSCPEEWQHYTPQPHCSGLTSTIEDIFSTHHILAKEESQFFTLNLLIRSCAYESLPMKEQLIDFIDNDSIVYQATETFMTQFSKKVLPIPTENYDSIFTFVLGSHLYAHLYDQMDCDYNAYSLSEEITQDFPTYHTDMAPFIQSLYQQTQAALFLEATYLTQRYFMIETFLNPTRLFGFPIKVRIETDLPEIYEQTIKKNLYDLFKYDYHLIFITPHCFQQADIVLTTVGSERIENNLVRFTYPLNKRDFLKIRDRLDATRKMIEYVE